MPTRDRERVYRTEAVVLGRLEFGEADRVVTLFTPYLGKLRVVAKGVRRPTSKLGPHLEYFTRVNLMVAKGRDLDLVTGAETIEPYLALRSNLAALGHASHMVELLNRLTEDRQENVRAYELLVRSLSLLADGVDPFPITRHYELSLLTLMGYKPELYRCVQCQSEIVPAANVLSPWLGGLLCPICRTADVSASGLTINAQKYLRTLDRSGLTGVIGFTLDNDLAAEIESALNAYIRNLSERDLSSLRVMRALEDPVTHPLL